MNKDNHASGATVATMTFAYDTAGNLLIKSKDGTAVQTFTYNALNQVASYSDGTLTTNYLYGAQGERIEKSGGATLTSVWDGGMIAMDLPKLSDATSFRGYLNGAGNNGMVRNGVWTPRIPDRAGSTAGTPAGATFSALTNYEGYGNQKAGPSLTPTSNPYGYDGYYTDAESGLCYLNARYYDPTTQRFTQQDPALDGGNWYGYCGGDPVNRSDPSGLYATVSNGSRNGDVVTLQKRLIKLGYGCGPCGPDGKFGKATEQAVRRFQLANGLKVDGIVGPKTWAKLMGGGAKKVSSSKAKATTMSAGVTNVDMSADQKFTIVHVGVRSDSYVMSAEGLDMLEHLEMGDLDPNRVKDANGNTTGIKTHYAGETDGTLTAGFGTQLNDDNLGNFSDVTINGTTYDLNDYNYIGAVVPLEFANYMFRYMIQNAENTVNDFLIRNGIQLYGANAFDALVMHEYQWNYNVLYKDQPYATLLRTGNTNWNNWFNAFKLHPGQNKPGQIQRGTAELNLLFYGTYNNSVYT